MNRRLVLQLTPTTRMFSLAREWRVSLIVGLLAVSCSSATPSADVPVADSDPAPATGRTLLPADDQTADSATTNREQAPVLLGQVDGQDVYSYTLTNESGLVLEAINYGAIITKLHVPDRNGERADVVLGFDRLEQYLDEPPYFGATIGRVANRIANATFELKGQTYKLASNDDPHHLHGGVKGWDKVVWNAVTKATPAGPALVFTYTSKDGEEGYPGNVVAQTTYTLTNTNELRVEMTATTDATTLVSMAHHTYWNLGGYDSGTITDHQLQIFADSYTPGANGLVPDGTVKPVEGTPFDFRSPKVIGRDLQAAGGDPIGFDHNWIIDGEANEMRQVARLTHPASGRVMTLHADKPGLQFYSGNFLDGSLTGKGATYPQYSGLCLETQNHPNSINIERWKDAIVLEPGETYSHTMVHRFTTE